MSITCNTRGRPFAIALIYSDRGKKGFFPCTKGLVKTRRAGLLPACVREVWCAYPPCEITEARKMLLKSRFEQQLKERWREGGSVFVWAEDAEKTDMLGKQKHRGVRVANCQPSDTKPSQSKPLALVFMVQHTVPRAIFFFYRAILFPKISSLTHCDTLLYSSASLSVLNSIFYDICTVHIAR